MNWNQKKVLVTGAGGFIGSHLVERLVELGASVRALVRYNSRNDWGLLELSAGFGEREPGNRGGRHHRSFRNSPGHGRL